MVGKGYDSVHNMDPKPLKLGSDEMFNILLPNYPVDACASVAMVATLDLVETRKKKIFSGRVFKSMHSCTSNNHQA